ncbi:hypothetical protein [Leptospira bandrabouensis]|uniref:Uncharacterized protein n=1 Tax=Leptospira bandrabouensis TaxID=2484903 RepID=A0A6H3NMH8_9LEPT|nr:hypothetical protein [Leptospira bandrabouensis]TGN07437.1 hypothetical protein EHR07_04765 [Leptospira bandrabouensis]TGN12818.1 hypothetical protein EHR08_15840 [Leptospira bandrabouensis]
MKTKASFNVVIPSKAEDKKIKKLLAEVEKENKEKVVWDYKKAKHPDGSPVKHRSLPKKKKTA